MDEKQVEKILKQNTELLERNVELSKQILELSSKTSKYLLWQQIFGILKIVIVIGPIVLGIIYLPPLLKTILAEYKNILGMGANMESLSEVAPDLMKFLK